jgi:two-component sensor histidine kinase
LALGIVFNELATNAVKYGALSNETGSILINWSTESMPAGARLILNWQEKDGPPVSAPSRVGFGSRVITRSLADELEGTVNFDFRRGGLVCAMTIPIRAPV